MYGKCRLCSRSLAHTRRYASTSSQSTIEPSTSKNAIPQTPKATVPPLPRPFGVSGPSTQSVANTTESKLERNMAKRKVLLTEINKSYFQDFAQVKSTGGKLWMAPQTLITEKRSLYFPDLQGTCLANKETRQTADMLRNKVSLLAVTTTRLSDEHNASFLTLIPEELKQDPIFQVIQINLQENPLKSFLISMFLSTLRKQVPPSQHANYLLVNSNLELLHEALGMSNRYIGYLYLIDWEKRIRWAACGFAEGNEGQGMVDCIQVLLGRLKEVKK